MDVYFHTYKYFLTTFPIFKRIMFTVEIYESTEEIKDQKKKTPKSKFIWKILFNILNTFSSCIYVAVHLNIQIYVCVHVHTLCIRAYVCVYTTC